MWLVAIALLILGIALYDIFQRKHTVMHNFPLIGRFRYWIEALGPEFRQYIVTGNDEERPFSRDQRRWIYSTAKKQNSYFGFGSDNNMESSSNYIIIKHSTFPISATHPGDPGYDPSCAIPSLKVVGKYRSRKKSFAPQSVINISAMSYGSLSGAAVEAFNKGCGIAGALQNTGEGGIAPQHRHGSDLVWQIGTGYYGCRKSDGSFCLEKLVDTVQAIPEIKAIEIKLSQGAKPGVGGILPGAKVTQEIATIRGVPLGKDCLSPNRHSTFSDADSLLDFVEKVADATGLPVGIKSAVGQLDFWNSLAQSMSVTDRGVDFITIDGGEGGTGAGPLVFTDHVALPFNIGFSRVYRIFDEHNLTRHITFVGSGRLGLPETAITAFCLGCDLVNVAREAMLAIGCIQSQRCHTGHCPTGITTQNRWLMGGLDPSLKAARLANYLVAFRKELLRLSHACGVEHPALLTLNNIEFLDGFRTATPGNEAFGYPTDFSSKQN